MDWPADTLTHTLTDTLDDFTCKKYFCIFPLFSSISTSFSFISVSQPYFYLFPLFIMFYPFYLDIFYNELFSQIVLSLWLGYQWKLWNHLRLKTKCFKKRIITPAMQRLHLATQVPTSTSSCCVHWVTVTKAEIRYGLTECSVRMLYN